MYEEYSAELPDEALYWERLGLTKPAPGAATLEFLDQMVFAHQSRIPFENISVHDYGQRVSLKIEDVFDKIIRGKRGGFCFELGALFGQLLKAAGYDTAPCISRNVRGKDFLPPIMHRGELVDIDGQRHYCDVGYGGPMASCALPLIDGAERTAHGQTFRMTKLEGPWWCVSYLSARTGEAAPVIHFIDCKQENVDFIPLALYCDSDPESVFVLERLTNRRTEDGSVSIRNNQFTQVTAQGRMTREIADDAEMREILAEHFGIELPAEPKLDVRPYTA